MRSGNLGNNHSAESLRRDVPAAPRALRKTSGLWPDRQSPLSPSCCVAGQTPTAAADFRAEQYSSRWKDGKKRGAWGSRRVCSQIAIGTASQNTAVFTVWVTEMHFYLISLPFRCKVKSALIQSAFPSNRRWYLVVKTASVQLKDVFTNHTDTFCYRTNLCPCAPTATLAFFLLFFFATTQPLFLNVEVHGQTHLYGL